MNLFRVMNTVPRTILPYEYSSKNNIDIFTTSLFQPLTLVKFFKSQGFLANTDISCNTLPVLTCTHVNNNIKTTYQKQGFFNVVCSCKIICKNICANYRVQCFTERIWYILHVQN